MWYQVSAWTDSDAFLLVLVLFLVLVSESEQLLYVVRWGTRRKDVVRLPTGVYVLQLRERK